MWCPDHPFGIVDSIQLNPSYASAHSLYAMYLVAMKRFDEAVTEVRKALELDPTSLRLRPRSQGPSWSSLQPHTCR
jgi:tetratricopeptide (TPR) repeat protein